ncbi:hypothetical protein [Kaarinaea lacus]
MIRKMCLGIIRLDENVAVVGIASQEDYMPILSCTEFHKLD